MHHDTIAVACALVAAGASALPAAFGALRWWQVRQSEAFWVLTRGAQIVVLVQAAAVGVLAALGFAPADGLFWLYALLPVAIGAIAEQLRVSAAEQVLELRGLQSARAMEALPGDAQRSIVVQILRREMGIMALAAATACFLLVRAALVA